MLNLSDYATEIKYIPLETNDAVLISPINLQIIYENDYLLIQNVTGTSKQHCYLFDNTGKFCGQIGKLGQGPDDYLTIDNVALFENYIYVITWHKILKYDTNGNLIENFNLKSDEIPEIYKQSAMRKIVPLKKDVYVVNVVTGKVNYPTAFLLEAYQSSVKTIKEFPSSVKFDRLGGYNSIELGSIYLYKEDVRIYKPINDTIFTIDQNAEMKGTFIFELGKYRPTLAFWEGKEDGDTGDPMKWAEQVRNNFKKYIFPNSIYESIHHLFIKFDFGNHSPEPYEKSHLGQQYTAFDVYGVFDKRTGNLTLMRQPIKGKLGFKNDIDGGPVIFPHYLSSNNELVTFIQPEEFMEYYDNIQNPSAELKKIDDKLKIDDNPILIIAKLN